MNFASPKWVTQAKKRVFLWYVCTQKDTVQQISVAHTQKILGGKTGLVFYDVTTLYFETDSADELRKTRFSKDGKHSQPQVVLGLLVSSGGYPLACSIDEGNKYEGHAMLPVVENKAMVNFMNIKKQLLRA